MGNMKVFIDEDIVLDKAAFDTAISDFDGLIKQLEGLRSEIEEMLDSLQKGFNTPAGAKFIKSCNDNLFIPLDAQKEVLNHIKETLSESKQKYETVFREYESLQTAIKQVNNK